MKTILSIFLTITTFLHMNAQEFEGVAKYTSIIEFSKYEEILKDPTTSIERRKEILSNIEFIKEFLQHNYTLEFNKNESYFNIEERLSLSGEHNNDAETIGNFYKNFNDQIYISKMDMSGKIFYVSENIPQYKWILEDETKSIGNYLCHKATFTEQKPAPQRVEKEDGTFEFETVLKDVIITAWYTPELPISNGPALYGGLPGLILEVSNNQQPYPLTIRCVEMSINPSKKVKIKRPNAKKTFTKEEYKIEIEKRLN